MKPKHLFLAVAALLVGGGLWFARSAWRTHTLHQSSRAVENQMPRGRPEPGQMRRKPGQMLRPPNPLRRFADFTPEQRVEFARQGHGPGG